MDQDKKLTLGIWPTPVQELRGFRDILGDEKPLQDRSAAAFFTHLEAVPCESTELPQGE